MGHCRHLQHILGGHCFGGLWNVRTFGTESVLVGHIVHRVDLAIGSCPRVAARDSQNLVLLALVPDLSLFLSRLAVTGLVTGAEEER